MKPSAITTDTGASYMKIAQVGVVNAATQSEATLGNTNTLLSIPTNSAFATE